MTDDGLEFIRTTLHSGHKRRNLHEVGPRAGNYDYLEHVNQAGPVSGQTISKSGSRRQPRRRTDGFRMILLTMVRPFVSYSSPFAFSCWHKQCPTASRLLVDQSP